MTDPRFRNRTDVDEMIEEIIKLLTSDKRDYYLLTQLNSMCWNFGSWNSLVRLFKGRAQMDNLESILDDPNSVLNLEFISFLNGESVLSVLDDLPNTGTRTLVYLLMSRKIYLKKVQSVHYIFVVPEKMLERHNWLIEEDIRKYERFMIDINYVPELWIKSYMDLQKPKVKTYEDENIPQSEDPRPLYSIRFKNDGWVGTHAFTDIFELVNIESVITDKADEFTQHYRFKEGRENYEGAHKNRLGGMFQDVSNLVGIELPPSWGHMELVSSMFSGCSSLKWVLLPDSWGKIKDVSYMFEKCSSLEEITLPASWDDIVRSKDMFNKCARLKTIRMGDTDSNIYVLSPDSSDIHKRELFK